MLNGSGPRRAVRWLIPTLLLVLAGCSGSRDSAEEHRRLSLRVEHQPPQRVVANEDAELHALIVSSLEAPRLEAWIRVLGPDGAEERIPLRISEDGSAVGRIPARPRGTKLRYVVEARDAAGLVVSLPKGARDGSVYTLEFAGRSSRVLGGIAWLSALLATLLFLGAGAASAQSLRGRMSAGPAGMLGGFGVAVAVGGLLLLGAIHAYQVTGRPWPSSPVVLAISRGDLAIVSLIWIVNLVLGRKLLLDEADEDTPSGQRTFAVAGAVAGVLTLIFLLF